MAKSKPQSNTVIQCLVHWPLMGGLLHLVQQGGPWVGCGPAHSLPRCTKFNSPPINGQCTNFILFNVTIRDHISSSLRQLHWLPIAERVTSSAFSSTTQQLDERRLTLLTYFSRPPPLHRGPRCEPQVVETMSCHGQIENSQIEHSPLLYHGRGTNCRLVLK